MIAALAGRRIDAPNPAVSRFPAGRIDQVQQSVRKRFVEDKVTALVCAAACGADLLALSAASELGLRRHIVLPFPTDYFKKESVIDRGRAPWEELYDRFIAEAESANDLRLLELDVHDAEAYEKTNKAIIDDALAIAAAGEDDVEALVVWDKRPQTEIDYTAHFMHYAERHRLLIKQIPILDA